MNQPTRPFVSSLQQLQAAFWLRRVVLWLVRAAWLSLLAPSVFMAGYLWLGWQVRWQDWVIPMLAVALAALLWSIRPLRLKRVVKRLDNRLDLQTRLVTAFEVSRKDAPADNLVVDCLLDESEQIVTGLRRRVRLVNRSLWVEMQALIAVLALLGALLLLDALSPRLPQVTADNLSTTWHEPTAQEVEQGPGQAQSIAPKDVKTEPKDPQNFQDALQILADALRDHAATHAIAEAIDQRDLHRAAEGLRRLADQLDQLSPQGRRELQNSMQEAGEKVGDMAPSMTKPLLAGSQALAKNDLPKAGQSLEELAKVIEQVQTDPAEVAERKPVEQQNVPAKPQQQKPLNPKDSNTDQKPNENPPPENEQPPEEQRLTDEGKPLKLESDPKTEEKVVQAGDPNAKAAEKQTNDTPFTRQPLRTPDQALGRDPLVYPWEQREVIRRYFTP